MQSLLFFFSFLRTDPKFRLLYIQTPLQRWDSAITKWSFVGQENKMHPLLMDYTCQNRDSTFACLKDEYRIANTHNIQINKASEGDLCLQTLKTSAWISNSWIYKLYNSTMVRYRTKPNCITLPVEKYGFYRCLSRQYKSLLVIGFVDHITMKLRNHIQIFKLWVGQPLLL